MIKKYYFCIFVLFFLAINSYSQNFSSKKANYHSKSSSMRVVSPLSSKSNLILAKEFSGEIKDGRSSRVNPIIGKGSKGDDILVLNKKGKTVKKIPGKNPELVFDAAFSSSQPTDPSVAVGPNHVIAVFNTGYRIFDKAGTALTAELSPDNLFSNGSCCDLTVSYDNAANRWVMSILYSSDGHVEVAVSQGADPVNDSWSVYSFPNINDYQKLSVWSDGYYMTANVNSDTAGTTGDAVFVMDRTAMLAGEATAQIIAFPLPGIATNGFYSPQAFNVSNNDMPALGNAPIVYHQDDAFNGITEDHIKIWTIDVDFDTPANSTISQPTELNTAPFVGVFDGGAFDNLPQPNGGVDIDALQATIMNQAQFRKFPTHNSAVFSFTVDTDGSGDVKLAGIRWYELRQSGDGQPWSIYQEGTYTGANGKHAWNGSMMMDKNGNIALGYSGMGGTSETHVSSYYTGRYSSNDLGTMPITETLIAEGNGNVPSERYGDYAKMDIDPINDEKFWFNNEYVNTNRANVVGVFQIAPDKQIDAGVVSINLPESGSFTNNENISISIFNFGIDPISNFEVEYQVDGGAIVTETFTGTIQSSESADFTFSQPVDLSIEEQIYTITATTNLLNDEVNSNDSTTITVENLYRNDIGITAITSPTSAEGLGSEFITVIIENFGGVAQSNFDVSYTIDGGSPVVETVTESIASNNSLTYTFSTPADFSIEKTYMVSSTTSLINDSVSNNNSTTINIDNQLCESAVNNTPQTIDEENPNTITSSIDFANDFIVTALKVEVNIEHTWDSDLILKLISPDGTTEVELSSENGDDEDNYTNTIFDDFATESITSGSAPFTGTFKPQEPLSNFNGLSSKGNWTLSIEDTVSEDGGQLLDWTIKLCSVPSILGVTENFSEDAEFLIFDKGDNQYDIDLNTTEITEQLTLNVYNMLGQKLLDYRLQNENGKYHYDLDMSYAQQGIYIVTLSNGTERVHGRIIKQ